MESDLFNASTSLFDCESIIILIYLNNDGTLSSTSTLTVLFGVTNGVVVLTVLSCALCCWYMYNSCQEDNEDGRVKRCRKFGYYCSCGLYFTMIPVFIFDIAIPVGCPLQSDNIGCEAIAGIFLAMASGTLCIVLCLNCMIGFCLLIIDDWREYWFPPRYSTPYRHLPKSIDIESTSDSPNTERTNLENSNPEAHISSLADCKDNLQAQGSHDRASDSPLRENSSCGVQRHLPEIHITEPFPCEQIQSTTKINIPEHVDQTCIILGDVHTLPITHQGGTFPLHPFGPCGGEQQVECCATLEAPPGVVDSGVTVSVHYAIIEDGPFKFPEEWERTSVVLYMDCPEKGLLKELLYINLRHWAVRLDALTVMKADHTMTGVHGRNYFVFDQFNGFSDCQSFSDAVIFGLMDHFYLLCTALKCTESAVSKQTAPIGWSDYFSVEPQNDSSGPCPEGLGSSMLVSPLKQHSDPMSTAFKLAPLKEATGLVNINPIHQTPGQDSSGSRPEGLGSRMLVSPLKQHSDPISTAFELAPLKEVTGLVNINPIHQTSGQDSSGSHPEGLGSSMLVSPLKQHSDPMSTAFELALLKEATGLVNINPIHQTPGQDSSRSRPGGLSSRMSIRPLKQDFNPLSALPKQTTLMKVAQANLGTQYEDIGTSYREVPSGAKEQNTTVHGPGLGPDEHPHTDDVSTWRDNGSRLSSERDVANALTPDKGDLESSEVQTEIDADMIPSDVGLQGILKMLPLWTQYVIPLGLSINQLKYYQEQPQESTRGLLALQYWRDGQCGSDYPGTWRFLLDIIKDHLGPKVAMDLKTKVVANKTWTRISQAGRDNGSRLSSERDVANALTPGKGDLESSEVQTEIDAGMIPSDIGLQETLEILPNWQKYAISLGLSIEEVKSCEGLPQRDMGGLLALKHWRDGKCGSGYPGTWRFLIGVIKDCLGPNVAEDLKKKVNAKKTWTCTSQADLSASVPRGLGSGMPILPLNPGSLVPLSTALKQTSLKEVIEHIDITPELETSGQGEVSSISNDAIPAWVEKMANNWINFGVTLGFSEEDLQSIKDSNGDDVARCSAMMYHWLRTGDRREKTHERLLRAAKEATPPDPVSPDEMFPEPPPYSEFQSAVDSEEPRISL